MSRPKFFTDEDVYAAIAPALRTAGFDAVGTPEVGRLGESDESQLQWSTSEGRAIVSFNVGHFAALHADWLSRHQRHAGIIVSSQRMIGDTIRRLIHLGTSLDEDGIKNEIIFLSDW